MSGSGVASHTLPAGSLLGSNVDNSAEARGWRTLPPPLPLLADTKAKTGSLPAKTYGDRPTRPYLPSSYDHRHECLV